MEFFAVKKLSIICLVLCAVWLSAVDPADYGAGEMKKSGRTFYVSTKGNDKNDGTSPEKAFRTIKYGATFLRSGDTLLVAGGEYAENEVQLNVKDNSAGYTAQCGKPGSPIPIMGVPGEKAVLRGGNILRVKTPGLIQTFRYGRKIIYDTVQEYPSGIELKRLGEPEMVKKTPGTYFYDQQKKFLLVHFTALDQQGISVARSRIGMRIHGSFIHIENLHFTNYYEGIYVRMNQPYDKNRASHITVKNCWFYNNYKNGLVFDGALWSLVTGCRGWGNTEKGSFMTMARSADNLFYGNWCGNEAMTLRQRPEFNYNYSINNYGGNPPRNHVIGNVMDNKLSFRWKQASPGSHFKDNILTGSFYAESKVVPASFSGNLFKGKVGWIGIGWDLWEKDFAGTPVKFSSNVRKREQFSPKDKIVFAAEKLAVKLPEIKFPPVIFKNLQVKQIAHDGAVFVWETPGCDGWGEISYREKGTRKWKCIKSPNQGSSHVIGIAGLKKSCEYEYVAQFINRRGGKKNSAPKGTFKTLSRSRQPKVLEVGEGKLSLAEAGCAAMPGDTVKLLPGRHVGQLSLIRSGLPGKPVTVTGKDAVIDGKFFHAPLLFISGKKHIVIDGISFENAENSARKNVIRFENCSDIIFRNCRVKSSFDTGRGLSAKGENITVENNVFNGGDYIVGLSGKNMKLLRNTIVNGTLFSTSFWHVSDLEVRDNIFYISCIPVKRNPQLLICDIKGKVTSEGNVFYSPLKEHPIGGRITDKFAKVLKESRTLEEWQKYGYDKKSIHADPLFVDYKNGDFRLKSGSPAQGKGANIK